MDEFCVSLTPVIQDPGHWEVRLEKCSVPNLQGPKGKAQATLTRQQLVRLRDRHGWPNLMDLKTIGEDVWRSLKTPELEAAFLALLQQSLAANRGMRLVFSIDGDEPELADPHQIRLQELPLEALYVDNFLATAPNTPVSRRLKPEPDREPYRTGLPLRLLVVVATPRDRQPDADMEKEKQVIKTAVQKLIDTNAVQLDFCDPPTRTELTNRLKQGFHIFHFIGHGAFEIVGDDPSPRPHLCLESPDGSSDPIDSETLAILLQATGVRLVVMTACSSAAAIPINSLYYPRVFGGFAQRLISGPTGVSAVVAMQFDLESDAAVTFSRTFYNNLLVPGLMLDEVVARCREALALQMDTGHRSWVTPVLYWRCKNAQVFSIEGLVKALSPEERGKLTQVEFQIKFYLDQILSLKEMPEDVQQAAEPLRNNWQLLVEEMQKERGKILGTTLRLLGGQVKVGESIPCRLQLRLRTPAQVGDVKAIVRYPQQKVQLIDVKAGTDTADINLMMPLIPGQNDIWIQNVSKGVQWDPGEYELGLVTFQVQPGVDDFFVEIEMANAKVFLNQVEEELKALNAIIWVSLP